MRTTLDLPDPLFREVKTRAVQQGVKLKELVTRYIEAGLRDPSMSRDLACEIRQRSVIPVAIPHVPGSPMTPALTNAEIQAILDDEDADCFRKLSSD